MYALPLEPPSNLPPHPTPLGCHRAPALGSLHHTANYHWLSIIYDNVYVSIYSLKHPTDFLPDYDHKSVLYVCVSFADLQVG